MSKSKLFNIAAVPFMLAGAASMFARQFALGGMWIALGATFIALAKKSSNPPPSGN
jgi:hypothetical protein